LQNTGAVAGKEVVQLYLRPVAPGLRRPMRELKAFTKIALEPGEVKPVSLTLTPRDFQYFDPAEQRFVLRAQGFIVEIAASSRDIRLTAQIACASEPPALPRLTTGLPPPRVFAHPKARSALVTLIEQRLNLQLAAATALVDSIADSFLGIYDALSWHVGDSLPEGDLQALFDVLNQG
jgi:beta-glucosidase